MTELQTPLEGLRLLDLGRYQAGPRCALMFARMGAEVIKVESVTGDESRRNGPRVRGQSAYWVQYNSGKKSLAINLRTDEGKEVLRKIWSRSQTSSCRTSGPVRSTSWDSATRLSKSLTRR